MLLVADNMGQAQRHLHSTIDLRKITVRHHLWWLIADTDLESSRAPVNELDCTLGLEGGDSGVCVLRNDISAVEQARSHVFAVAGITFDHLAVWLEAGHRDFLGGICLVGSLSGRDNGSVRNQGEVDARIWDEIGLELVEINIEGAVETEGGCDGGDDWLID